MDRPSWTYPLSDQVFRSLSRDDEAKYRNYIGRVIENLDPKLSKRKDDLAQSIFDYEEDLARVSTCFELPR